MKCSVRMSVTIAGLSLVSSAGAQTVVDVLPATDGAWGLDYHDGALWQGDDLDGFIYKLSPIDGAILDTIPTPFDEDHITSGANHGVAWDDTSMWVAGDFGKRWLYQLDAAGATVDSIPSPTEAAGGLSWADSLLLVSAYYPDKRSGIIRIDADGSPVGLTIPVSGEQPFGVAFDFSDSTMWTGMDDLDGDAETIDQFTYPLGEQLTQFLSPADSPKGITIGAGHLWLVADNNAGPGRRIYKIDIGNAEPADIALDPESYDFGIVAIGDTTSYEHLILNEGAADLEITDVLILSPFTVETDTLPQIIAPGDTLHVDVTFTPVTIGDVERMLTVASDDVDEPSITATIAGTGAPPGPFIVVSPGSIPFPDTGLDLVRDETVSIENFGIDSLIVNDISIDDPAFTLVFDRELPDSLSTFEALSIRIVFAPTDLAPHTATLTIQSNDPSNSIVNRPVTGAGIEKSFVGGDIIWAAPGIEDVVNALAIPDINGDGIADAVMESFDAGANPGDPHRVYYGNSDEDGVLLWSLGDGQEGGYGEQALAPFPDIDADTFPEIVRGVSGDGRRVELRESESGNLLWEFDTTPFDGGGWIYSVAVLPDVTTDGVDEVLAALGTDSGVGTGARRVVCLNGADGVPVWMLTGPDAFLSVAAGEDVNGDLVPDAVAGAGGNGADTKVWCIDGASVGTATDLWTFDTGGAVWSVAFIDDVTGDGINDVVAGSGSQNVFCLDGVTGDLEWTAPIGGGVLRVEVIDDVSDDGVPDVAVANLSPTFRVLSGATGLPLWVLDTGESTWTTSSIDDVSGDGIRDVLAGSQDDDVYCADGVTGDILWQTTLGPLVHVVRAIPDVNGNGYADVLAGTQRLGEEGGDLFCLEGGAVVVGIEETPAAVRGIRFTGLSANPMPGRGAFVFDVNDADGSTVEVSIFDAGGRHVRSLLHRVQPGTSQLAWDGLDAAGRRVQSGAYFFRIRGLQREGRSMHAVTGKITLIQ